MPLRKNALKKKDWAWYWKKQQLMYSYSLPFKLLHFYAGQSETVFLMDTLLYIKYGHKDSNFAITPWASSRSFQKPEDISTKLLTRPSLHIFHSYCSSCLHPNPGPSLGATYIWWRITKLNKWSMTIYACMCCMSESASSSGICMSARVKRLNCMNVVQVFWMVACVYCLQFVFSTNTRAHLFRHKDSPVGFGKV